MDEHEPLSELETIRQEKERLAVELEASGSTIAGLKQAAATRDKEMAEARQSLGDLENRVEHLNSSLNVAVSSYRALVVDANPGVLAELICGNTVDEVNESLKKARRLVERVKQELESKAAESRIPAGAPPRAPADLSSLSSREKITHGIGGK